MQVWKYSFPVAYLFCKHHYRTQEPSATMTFLAHSISIFPHLHISTLAYFHTCIFPHLHISTLAYFHTSTLKTFPATCLLAANSPTQSHTASAATASSTARPHGGKAVAPRPPPRWRLSRSVTSLFMARPVLPHVPHGRLGAGEARARGWGLAGKKNLWERNWRAEIPENPIKQGVCALGHPQDGQKGGIKNFKEFLLHPVDKPKKLCHTSHR